MNYIFLLLLLVSSVISSAQNWNEDEKKLFYEACRQEAGVTMTENASSYYCRCTVDKIVASFPEGPYDTLITADAVELLAAGCIAETENKMGDLTYKMTWDDSSKQAFMKTCDETLKKDQAADSKKYCTCILSRIILDYPDPQFLKRIPEEEIRKLSVGCK